MTKYYWEKAEITGKLNGQVKQQFKINKLGTGLTIEVSIYIDEFVFTLTIQIIISWLNENVQAKSRKRTKIYAKKKSP